MTDTSDIRKEVVVDASQARAFEVFTAGMNRWWPRGHHIGASPLKEVKLEPMTGGRWYSISEDDSQCDTGKVLAWDPPKRVHLTWQITSDWKYDPNFVTEVEVTFTPIGERQTQVVLEHRYIHRYGVAAAPTRAALDSPGGWGGMLLLFKGIAEGAD